MADQAPKDSSESFEKALQDGQKAQYILRLYVSGNTHKSYTAITNLRKICQEHLEGRYQLEVIDIRQQPSLARSEQIVATPTLIKQLPLPIRRIIGDLSEEEKILVGLAIEEANG